jgi:membrane protease YdiL (CAAX protease family)
MTSMDHEPDYSQYTFDELLDAASHINREKLAERANRIDVEIARRSQESKALSETVSITEAAPVPSNGTPLQEIATCHNTEEKAEPILETSDEQPRSPFWWVLLRGLLWATVPFAFPIFLLYSVLKPAVKGKEPNGFAYVLWVLGLVFFNSICMVPIGSVTSMSGVLRSPSFCLVVLVTDIVASVITAFLILLTFRKRGIPNSFIPFRRFRMSKRVILLWALSFLPLASLLAPVSNHPDPSGIIHPLILALISSLKTTPYGSVVLGFMSFVLMAPIIEEVIFRGLLVEESHAMRRRKVNRYFLDFLVCLLFATLHTPIAFFMPFLLAVGFIYVRRHTGSLIPSMVMHASWNLSVLVSVARNYS